MTKEASHPFYVFWGGNLEMVLIFSRSTSIPALETLWPNTIPSFTIILSPNQSIQISSQWIAGNQSECRSRMRLTSSMHTSITHICQVHLEKHTYTYVTLDWHKQLLFIAHPTTHERTTTHACAAAHTCPAAHNHTKDTTTITNPKTQTKPLQDKCLVQTTILWLINLPLSLWLA